MRPTSGLSQKITSELKLAIACLQARPADAVKVGRHEMIPAAHGLADPVSLEGLAKWAEPVPQASCGTAGARSSGSITQTRSWCCVHASPIYHALGDCKTISTRCQFYERADCPGRLRVTSNCSTRHRRGRGRCRRYIGIKIHHADDVSFTGVLASRCVVSLIL